MKTESSPEPKIEETVEPPSRKIASKLVSEEETRPVITCECARWGTPCPHSFWSEEIEAAANAN